MLNSFQHPSIPKPGTLDKQTPKPPALWMKEQGIVARDSSLALPKMYPVVGAAKGHYPALSDSNRSAGNGRFCCLSVALANWANDSWSNWLRGARIVDGRRVWPTSDIASLRANFHVRMGLGLHSLLWLVRRSGREEAFRHRRRIAHWNQRNPLGAMVRPDNPLVGNQRCDDLELPKTKIDYTTPTQSGSLSPKRYQTCVREHQPRTNWRRHRHIPRSDRPQFWRSNDRDRALPAKHPLTNQPNRFTTPPQPNPQSARKGQG